MEKQSASAIGERDKDKEKVKEQSGKKVSGKDDSAPVNHSTPRQSQKNKNLNENVHQMEGSEIERNWRRQRRAHSLGDASMVLCTSPYGQQFISKSHLQLMHHQQQQQLHPQHQQQINLMHIQQLQLQGTLQANVNMQIASSPSPSRRGLLTGSGSNYGQISQPNSNVNMLTPTSVTNGACESVNRVRDEAVKMRNDAANMRNEAAQVSNGNDEKKAVTTPPVPTIKGNESYKRAYLPENGSTLPATSAVTMPVTTITTTTAIATTNTSAGQNTVLSTAMLTTTTTTTISSNETCWIKTSPN